MGIGYKKQERGPSQDNSVNLYLRNERSHIRPHSVAQKSYTRSKIQSCTGFLLLILLFIHTLLQFTIHHSLFYLSHHTFHYNHSYLNASTGSILAALRAGYKPNTKPTKIETATAKIIDKGETTNSQSYFKAFATMAIR